MKILGVDFETQCADPQTTNVTEIGAALYHVGENLYYEAEQLSMLIHETTYPPQTEKIVELTGITDEMLREEGHPRMEGFARLLTLVNQADYVFAHNKSFDEVIFRAQCKKLNLGIPDVKWICTLTEINYPPQYTCKKLSHLAFEHDIPFDRASLHRAYDDVVLMMKLLAKYKLQDIIDFANEPWVYVQAIFPAPFESKIGFEVGKAKAFKLGFGWERARGDDREFPKRWVKRMKQRHHREFEIEAQRLGLVTKTLQA